MSRRRCWRVSASINPECEHIVGDMRTLRLGRTFDAVLIHDAICYMTSEADLRAAMATAVEHLRPGGVAVFEPDHVREQFEVGTDHGGEDGPPLPDGRPGPALRYLEWTTDPDPSDSTYQVEYAVLTRDADGTVRVRHDQHVEGLFPTVDVAGAHDRRRAAGRRRRRPRRQGRLRRLASRPGRALRPPDLDG